MTQQYGRKISLIVGQSSGDALDLSGLRIVFDVERGDIDTPNSAHIRVYNVSDNTARLVEAEFTRVVLQAGYEGNYGIIFDGSIVQVRRGRESPTDTYLDISAADGDAAYNFATVNATLAAGATQSDIVKVCADAMAPYGVSVGYVADLPANPLARGKVLFGLARDHLRSVSRSTNCLWSIQDGQLQIVPETSYVPGQVPVINAKSGMIGMPEQTQNGISVRMLLNPSIKIGRLIKLDNSSIQKYEYSLAVSQQVANRNAALQNKINGDGLYYVMNSQIWGDTRGNDWYTEVICLAVDATAGVQLRTAASGVSAPAPAKLGTINPYG
ncbi:phage protein [Paraburkholderia tropica]|uniref:phage protein n=1 Tax=Paraburkholderia tropica TaxID=92647 RepID=UPI003D29A6A5